VSRLFGRTASLVVDTLDISLLDYTFKVRKSLKPEPNTMDLEVYNLNDDHRSQLEQSKAVVSRLEVGYGGNNSQIFLGEIRSCKTEIRGADRVTKLSSGDKEKAIAKNRCKATYSAQVSVDTALSNIAKVLDVQEGNLKQAVGRLQSRGIENLFPRGIALYGKTWQVVQTIARSANLEISIQDGALLILEFGAAIQGGSAISLSSDPNNGLIGEPSEDADGTVTAECLIIPEIRPGVRVELDSNTVSGDFRVWGCEYLGATRGKDWNIKLTLKKIKAS
jgi:hypothetical protein